MPRRSRILVEDWIYHVYNRFARRADFFAEADEVDRFPELLRKVKERDGIRARGIWGVCSAGELTSSRYGYDGEQRAVKRIRSLQHITMTWIED